MADPFTLQGFETPEEVRARIGQARLAEEAAQAEGFGAGAGAFTAGRGLARALRGAFGKPEPESPEITQARIKQEVLKSTDFTSAQSIAEASKKFMQTGDIKTGIMLALKSLEIKRDNEEKAQRDRQLQIEADRVKANIDKEKDAKATGALPGKQAETSALAHIVDIDSTLGLDLSPEKRVILGSQIQAEAKSRFENGEFPDEGAAQEAVANKVKDRLSRVKESEPSLWGYVKDRAGALSDFIGSVFSESDTVAESTPKKRRVIKMEDL